MAFRYLIVLSAIFGGLVGCGAPSVDELVQHPQLLASVLADCRDMEARAVASETACINAYRAEDQVQMRRFNQDLAVWRKRILSRTKS